MKRAGENHLPVFFFRGGVAFRVGIKRVKYSDSGSGCQKSFIEGDQDIVRKKGKEPQGIGEKEEEQKKIEKSSKKDEKRC